MIYGGGVTAATLAHFQELRDDLHRRFEIDVAEPDVAGRRLTLERPRDAEALISEADFDRDERLPYWADIWPSALILAEVTASEFAASPGERGRLLELGCGLGLVSIVALQAGWDVLATDYYDDALAFARLNAWRCCGKELRTMNLDWRSPPTATGQFDRILGSDVLYEEPYAALVASILGRALAPDGEAIIADPGRVGVAGFVSECESHGMTVSRDAPREWRDGEVVQRITLVRVRRQP